MVFIVPALIVIAFLGVRFQKPKPEENTYLNKSTSYSIRGFFIVLIVATGILKLIEPGTLNRFDAPLTIFSLGTTSDQLSISLGGLLFAPFFFYSGYGIYQTFKERGKEYARKIPLQQILRHYLSYFIAWILFAITALALKSPYSISDYLWSAVGLARIGNENWYVFVMIFMYLFSYIALRIADKKTAVIINIILAVFFLFLLIKFEVPDWCWNTSFAYLFGVLYAYFKERIERVAFKNRINRWLLLFISFGLLLISLYLVNLIPFGDFQAFMFSLPTLFFCLMIVFFTMIFKMNNRILNFLGKNSFWIYLLYLLPFIWLRNVNFIYSNKYLLIITALVLTILLAFVFNKVFNYFWNLFAKNHGDASEQANVKLGIVLSYIALFVSLIGMFVVTPRVLEYVGDDQYGLLNFANSITSWLAVISSALAVSYVKFASEYRKENKDVGLVNTSFFRIFGTLALVIVVILGGGAGIFFGFNIQLSQYTASENTLILWLLLVSGVNVAINVFFSVFSSYLSYQKQFIFTKLLSLAVSFLTFALNLILAYATRNVLWISIAAAILTLISCVITTFYAYRKSKITFARESIKKTSPLIKAIMIFSSFVLLNSIVEQINVHLDKTLLGIMVDAQAVTDYTLSKYFTGYLLILVIAITHSYIPKIHEIVADKFEDYKVKDEKRREHRKKNKLELVELKHEIKNCNDPRRIEACIARIDEIKAQDRREYEETNELFKKADRTDLNELFIKISKMHMFITFLYAGGFVACGLEFVGLWLGVERQKIYYYALIPVCLDMLVYSVQCSIEIQRAMNKHKFLAFLYLGVALLNILVSVILIKSLPTGYEIWGAFIGTAFSIILGNIIILSIYNKFKIGLPIGRHMLLMIKKLFYAGVGVGAAMALRYLLPGTVALSVRFLIQGIVFVLLFLLMHIIFERKTTIPMFKKVFAKVKTMYKGAKEE